MVHLYRLILAVLALFASAGAMALQPITVPAWSLDGINFFTSKSAACSSVNTANQWPGATASFVSVSGLLCRYGVTFPGNPIEYQHLQLIVGSKSTCPANAIETAPGACACATNYIEENGQCKPKPSCPDGQHEEGGACVPDNCKPNEVRVNGVCVPEPPCPPGQTRVNGQCVKNRCPAAGSGAGDGWEMSGSATEYACVDQGISFDGPVMYCMVRVTNNFDFLVDGKRLYFGSGKYTGAGCSPGSGSGNTGGEPGTGGGTGGDGDGGGSGPKPPEPDAPPMPPPPPSTPPGPDGGCPPGTTKAPNGQCYGPTPPPVNPDGDGACPPGYVRAGLLCIAPSPPSGPGDNGGGTGGGGGGNGEGDGEGEQSGFGGNCASGFACEGDAIQCAMAREQHRRACQLFDDETAESKLYHQEKTKTGKVTGDLEGNRDVNLAGVISATDVFLGGRASCPSDPTITLHDGSTFTIPYSSICPYLAILGNILVIIASVSAVLIVIRRI